MGIIGPSGAGKTTLVRLMTGALAPTDGEVRVMGEDPLRFRRETRERIGYMPQSFALYPDLTTRENVDFVASLFGLLWWRRRRRTREVLQWVDLWDVRSRRAGRLSGGMQRRLELASALVHDPEIAFLDEPTAGIDPLLRATIWKELHRLRDAGRTLLVTTQYVNEAESCDAVVLIAEGRAIATGTPDELRRTAMGGDIVVIDTRDPVDAAALRRGPRHPPPRAGGSDTGPRHGDGQLRDAARPGRGRASEGRRGGVGRRGPALVRRGVRAARGTVAARPRQRGRRRARRRRRQGRLMHAPLAVIWRLLAFVGKELVETIRRPGALVSLVLGPFLIMAVFGAGFSGVRRPLETVIVIPDSSQLPRDAEQYQELAGAPLHIAEILNDRGEAESRLQAGLIDLIVIAPEDPEATFRSGQRSTIEIIVDETDPVDENYAAILGNTLADAVNRRLIEQAVEAGTGYIVEAGEAQAAAIPADVVAAPTESRLVNLAPNAPTVTSYFGPAVLALILQHLAVTLVSMSLVRERKSGVMEMFRISPVSSAEVLAGKVLAYGILGFVVAGLTAGLLVVGLGVPCPCRARLPGACDRPAAARLAGPGPPHRRGVGLGAAGGAALAAGAARIGVLQRVRAGGRRVHAARPRPRLRVAGHAWDPAAAGLHAPRLDQPTFGSSRRLA